MSRRIVVWSGGYDSTLVLDDEIATTMSAAPPDSMISVETVTFNLEVIGQDKLALEKSHRDAYVGHIRQKHNGRVFIKNHVVGITQTTLRPEGGGQLQALLFTTLCAIYSPANYVATFLFGFHRGDDYWKQKTQTHYILDYIANMTGKTIEFKYPLEYDYKHDVVRAIRQRGLEKFVWTCEDPQGGAPCGKCEPCQAIQTADFRIALEEKYWAKPATTDNGEKKP